MTSDRAPKRLIIRLSSLGDIILSTSSLSALGAGENHWLVAREYSGLLRGHPKLKKVWDFDRSRSGFLGWLSLCGELWRENFTEVLDLHSTLRSRVARIYFFIRARIEKREIKWTTISKERLRMNGLFLAKRFWPKAWNPTRMTDRFARMAGGTGAERPDLSHLVQGRSEVPTEISEWIAAHPEFLCVMPSSKWDGKKWSVRGFYEVIVDAGLPAVVLGDKKDRESHLLSKLLEQSQYPFCSAVGRLGFRELATVLSRARVCLGNDTGLAHLAEAVGTDVLTVFGPTVPEMGFGPWRAQSRSVGSSLWCKPCGKDGRFCFRFGDRYACQKGLKPLIVSRELQAVIGSNTHD